MQMHWMNEMQAVTPGAYQKGDYVCNATVGAAEANNSLANQLRHSLTWTQCCRARLTLLFILPSGSFKQLHVPELELSCMTFAEDTGWMGKCDAHILPSSLKAGSIMPESVSV